MKKTLTLLILFAAYTLHAQESFFKGNNNYQAPPVAPFTPPNIVTSGLILNLDAANPVSFSSTATNWSNLITGNAVTNFSISGGVYSSDNGGVLRIPSTGGYASSSTGFANLTAYSVEVWVKMAGTNGDQNPLTSSNYAPCLFSEKSIRNGECGFSF